jgi:hypothetical protein
MLPARESEISFLKQVLIFNEFEEDELALVADRLNTEFIQAGGVVYAQGEPRDNIYMVREGEVQVTRLEEDSTETFIALFGYADLFGEDALFFERPRSATVTAVSDTELWYLSEADFYWLRSVFPKVEPYLNTFTRTHQVVQKLHIKWLNEDETISLATRRHPFSMIIEILVITFLVLLTLTISMALITFLEDVLVVTVLSAGVSGLVTLIGLVAGLWSFFEWRNDYFFVTNLRVVWRERILFRSSSRQEVPLRRIQSLDVRTSNFVERMINVGDVVIRTFNSEMMLTGVNGPAQMKNMIDAFLKQAQQRFIRSEQAAIRRTIRSQLGYIEEESPMAPEVPTLTIQGDRKRFSLFKTRVVEDGIITYRKHWWIFFKGAWLSSLALFSSIFLAFYVSKTVFGMLGLLGLLVLYCIPFVISLWWLYEYADWRNDIYVVAKDRIIDRDKKPLGKESFRSAPINNIQSVGHEIPNTIGLILNVGNVRINVGEEILTFNGVHDPALVHQDISRRMEEQAANAEKNRIKQEHARMATWLDIYHDESKGEFNTGPVEHIPDFD